MRTATAPDYRAIGQPLPVHQRTRQLSSTPPTPKRFRLSLSAVPRSATTPPATLTASQQQQVGINTTSSSNTAAPSTLRSSNSIRQQQATSSSSSKIAVIVDSIISSKHGQQQTGFCKKRQHRYDHLTSGTGWTGRVLCAGSPRTPQTAFYGLIQVSRTLRARLSRLGRHALAQSAPGYLNSCTPPSGVMAP